MPDRINLQGWADVCDVASALLYFHEVGLIDRDTPLTMSLFVGVMARYFKEATKEPVNDVELAKQIIRSFGLVAPIRAGRHRVPKPRADYDTLSILRKANQMGYVPKSNVGDNDDKLDIADLGDLVEEE